MILNDRGPLSIIACESGRPLMQRMDYWLRKILQEDGHDPIDDNYQVVDSEEKIFANGEVKNVIKDVVRGKDLYIVQLFDDPLRPDISINDNIMSMLTMLDAARHSDTESITVIIPQFPYSRQERRTGREAISAKIIASTLETCCADRVITMDIHAPAIAGFFNKTKFENIISARRVMTEFKSVIYPSLNDGSPFKPEEFIVVAPDEGAVKSSREFASALGTELAIIDKERFMGDNQQVKQMTLVGDVTGKKVFIGDDMIDTGGTIRKACQLLKSRNAAEIYVYTTFPFFHNSPSGGDTLESFSKAYEEKTITKVIGTDCVFRGEEFTKTQNWYAEISMAKLFAEIICAINQRKSISELLV